MNTQVRWLDSPNVFARIRCAVCRGLLHPEDFRPDLFREDAVAALHEKHGPNVCFGCMDEAGRNETPVEDEWL